jgi:hypothetical protein
LHPGPGSAPDLSVTTTTAEIAIKLKAANVSARIVALIDA